MLQVSAPSLLGSGAYTPGLPREYVARTYGIPLEEVSKLGSAENPFGPSPKAVAAVEQAKSKLDIYPEWTARMLRDAIGNRYGFDPDCVVCGAGETEIIALLIRAFAGVGDRVLMHEPCFPIYHIFAENEGRVPVYASMGTDFDFAVDHYVDRLKHARPKVAFLTNPHSPTGRLMTEPDIERICEAAGGATLVALDEAYIHFSETEGSLHLTRDYPNLVVLRTFSKAFGLAGLRIGFALSANKNLIVPLINIKPTWNLGQMQIAAGAAAIFDDDHVSQTVQEIIAMRAHIAQRLAGLNRFRMVPGSRSNFFLLEILDGELDSTRCFQALLQRGVIVKDCAVSFRGLGHRYLRVDINTRKHMDRLAEALQDIEAGRTIPEAS